MAYSTWVKSGHYSQSFALPQHLQALRNHMPGNSLLAGELKHALPSIPLQGAYEMGVEFRMLRLRQMTSITFLVERN